ncbi:MAG: ATP-binding protein [Cyclobacteriaceae bacterium]|nr:ATP-binding protein [Cyclobacteriaceae bacterium]
MTMRHSEEVEVDKEKLKALYALVAKGEGEQLEFKRKATHPEKIVREMIAFANSNGGTVLIGVADDGSIPGVKFPDEELFAIQKALLKLSRPILKYKKEIISLLSRRYVLSLYVPAGKRKPYYIRLSRWKKACFIRLEDKSIKASREVQQIIYIREKQKNIQFTYGDHEQTLLRYLNTNSSITLQKFLQQSGLSCDKASSILIHLVLANVLRIMPDERGDQYSLKQ